MKDLKYLNKIREDKFPGLLGIEMTIIGDSEVRA